MFNFIDLWVLAARGVSADGESDNPALRPGSDQRQRQRLRLEETDLQNNQQTRRPYSRFIQKLQTVINYYVYRTKGNFQKKLEKSVFDTQTMEVKVV